MSAYDAVDLFSGGAGGWSLAARGLGLRVLGVETDPDCVATRLAAGLDTLQADVREVEPILARGLIASAPCQTFSEGGLRSGQRQLDLVVQAIKRLDTGEWPAEEVAATDDPRTALVLEPLRWALTTQPEWVALEQVPSVLPIWEAIAAVLTGRGYSTATGVLSAEQFGVPQARKRAVLVARLHGEAELPAATHAAYNGRGGPVDAAFPRWISMAEAIGWGLSDAPAPTVLTARGRQAGADVLVGSSWRRAWWRERIAESTWVPRPTDRAAHSQVRLTIEEAATLQSLPPGHPWCGPVASRFRQIGNAIPPLMAGAVLVCTGATS